MASENGNNNNNPNNHSNDMPLPSWLDRDLIGDDGDGRSDDEEDDGDDDYEYVAEGDPVHSMRLKSFLRSQEAVWIRERKQQQCESRPSKRTRHAKQQSSSGIDSGSDCDNGSRSREDVSPWTRLPHEVILYLLEYMLFWWGRYDRFSQYEEHHPVLQRGVQDIVGRFQNDPLRQWHLIFRSVGFSIDEYFVNMSTHPFVTFPMLSHVRYMQLVYPSTETDIILKHVTRERMPRLQSVELILDEFTQDQILACRWFSDLLTNKSFAATKIIGVELPSQVDPARQISLLEHISNSRQNRMKLISNLICNDTDSALAVAKIESIRNVEMMCSNVTAWKSFLEKCTRVDSLSVTVTDEVAWSTAGTEWLQVLKNASHLRRLSMSQYSMTHVFDTLPICNTLVELDIGTCVKSLRGISGMQCLERLRLVFFADMELNVEELAEIGKCPNLRHLAIFCSARRRTAESRSHMQVDFFEKMIDKVLRPNCTGIIRSLTLSTWMRINDKRPSKNMWNALARMHLERLHLHNFCLVDSEIMELCDAFDSAHAVIGDLGITDDIGFLQHKGLIALLKSDSIRGLILDKELLTSIATEEDCDNILRLGLLERLESFGDD